MKLQWDSRVTLGNVVTILGIIVAASTWHATTGTAVAQIKLDQAQAKIEQRALEARLNLLETSMAVNREQAAWIIKSLEQLQRDRGLVPPPLPKAP